MTADIAEQFAPGQWEFTPEVAAVFDEHVRASVPFYEAIQDLIAEVSDWLLPDGALVADLGAATGTTIAGVLARHPGRQLRAVLYDEAPDMLDRARAKLGPTADAAFDARRIQDGPFPHADADLTLALFTLQFLPLPERESVLRYARTSAAHTGALIVAEKVRPADSRWAEISNDVSHDYKAARGISDAAIRAKARALRGVLRPYPAPVLDELVVTAGWQRPETLFRWHNWVVLAAFREAA